MIYNNFFQFSLDDALLDFVISASPSLKIKLMQNFIYFNMILLKIVAENVIFPLSKKCHIDVTITIQKKNQKKGVVAQIFNIFLLINFLCFFIQLINHKPFSHTILLNYAIKHTKKFS